MFISKLIFDRRTLARRGIYQAHQALWDVFSDCPERTRDFLYRELAPGVFLTVSKRKPVPGPELKHLDVKDYAPRLRAGERVLFSLRANPVRKTRDENGKQVRHDIVQDMRKRLMAKGAAEAELPTRLELAERAAAEWLAARREHLGMVSEPNTIMAEAYDNQRFRKTRGGPQLTVSTLDVRGFARVTDPDALCTALYSGIGPAKAFGCGLLLIRRA